MKEAPLVRKPELGSDPDSNPSSFGRRSQTPFDPPRKSFWKQFWKWTGVFSLLSVAALFAYFKLTPHGRQTEIVLREFVPAALEAQQNPNLIFDRAHSDVVNILLIGRDVNYVVKKVYNPRKKNWANMKVVDEETPARSDTMLIVSLDRNRRVIHMVSLPRDARVMMPENKEGVKRAKLNAAHAYGGPEMLLKTIHDELGITIHHYAVIRFEGFKKLIDQVGGVEVDVIGALQKDGKRTRLKYDDEWGDLHIDLQPGKQILDGEKAHSYVRFRMDREGDPGRIKRQQQVMRALAKKLTQQEIWNIPALIQEIQKQFKTDEGFAVAQIASAAGFAKGIGDASKIQPLTLFGVYGTRGTLILNEPKNKKLLNYIFGSTFKEENFLTNSPSTENDEMGEENNSSPGAKAILRRAGVIKGGSDESTPDATATENSPSSSTEVSSTRDTSEDRSRLAASSSDGAPAKPARRARRVRRERSHAASDSRRSTPAPRRETRHIPLSTPDEAPAGDEASGESPVPVAEEQSTPASDDSPVPHAE